MLADLESPRGGSQFLDDTHLLCMHHDGQDMNLGGEGSCLVSLPISFISIHPHDRMTSCTMALVKVSVASLMVIAPIS